MVIRVADLQLWNVMVVEDVWVLVEEGANGGGAACRYWATARL